MDEKPIKILFLDHTAVLSGAELSLLNLVQRIDRARFAPTVLLFTDGPLVGALRAAGVAVEVLPLGDAVRGATRGSLGVGSLAKIGALFSSTAYTVRLARYIRRHNPDIVQCNSLKADILGGFAARLAGAKVIWHIRDRIEADYLPGAVVKVFRALARAIPHYVIANSQATLETLRLPQGKRWAVVYSGIVAGGGYRLQVTGYRGDDDGGLATEITEGDEVTGYRLQGTGAGDEVTGDGLQVTGERKDPQISQISQITGLAGQPAGRGPAGGEPTESVALPENSRFQIPGSRFFTIALVGRISPWKGQDVFIQAAAIVLKQFPACRFRIVGSALFGEDALVGQLKQLAATLGVAPQIEFMGFRKDVPEIISASTLVVHASTVPEPFGQVIVQAMAAGKPVVATRGGGVLEIVEDGITGLLVAMKDVDAMAQAICEILADPVRAKQMGEAGRARFLERFTIEKTVEAVEKVYASMATEQYAGVRS